MDCTGGRKSCHQGEKSAVLDLAAISLSVAYSIAAAAKFLTPYSSHPLKTRYLLASFRNSVLDLADVRKAGREAASSVVSVASP
jgi:hypothetical protein